MRFKNLAWMILALMVGAASSKAQSTAAPQANKRLSYVKLPLSFEVNRGQSGPQVKFISRGPGYQAFLTANGMTLALRASRPAKLGECVHGCPG